MAGLPLKSGADFYNLEAARLRLHNLGADPTEVGAGLIYFNTSTGLNTSQKARLYTGSAWKTIAFSEDLDMAYNALKERVDLLSGDVDTDAIISNMKEVSAFLEGFAEDASLMDLLNGKLNTSGGTINGNLLIGAPNNTSYRYLQFARSGYGSRLNIADGDLYVSFGGIDANGGLTATKVFSLGNNGIRYASDGKTYHDILHSGNIGSYKAGDADKLGGLEASGYAKNIKNLQSDLADIDIAFLNGIYGGKLQGAAGTFPTTDGGYQNGAFLSFGWVGYGVQISSRRHNTWLRTVENSAYSAWKQIAFTDSNVASATKLATARTIWGQSFDGTGDINGDLVLNNSSYVRAYFTDGTSTANILGINANNTLLIGHGIRNTSSIGIYGKKIYFAPNGEAIRMLINESGNVLIGTTTDNGSGARLQVAGDISIPNNHYISFSNTAKTPLYQLWMTGNDVFFVGRGSVENGHESVYCGNTIRFATGDSAWNNSASIDENGNLHVKGNIIADGEVSAGGAAEEGGNAGGGGAAEKITATIEEGLKFKEISHTLGDNVIVQVYEWNANGQTWDMVLTDVETTTNLVTVRFGNETDVPHKVVII